jgi:hypothetical protein
MCGFSLNWQQHMFYASLCCNRHVHHVFSIQILHTTCIQWLKLKMVVVATHTQLNPASLSCWLHTCYKCLCVELHGSVGMQCCFLPHFPLIKGEFLICISDVRWKWPWRLSSMQEFDFITLCWQHIEQTTTWGDCSEILMWKMFKNGQNYIMNFSCLHRKFFKGEAY